MVEHYDPHPGRCRSFRPVPGSLESVRCLDYEGTDHICRFPPRKPAMTTATSATYSRTDPKPWVRPDE